MKKLSFVLSAILYSSALYSDELDIANNFIKYKNIDREIVSNESLFNKYGSVIGTVYYLSGGGYIVVPKSRLSSPIKAYSLDGKFAEPYKKFLEEQLQLESQSTNENEKIKSRWTFFENYINSNRQLNSLTAEANISFLTTSWNKDYPYNSKFPKSADGSQTVTGCVQTALAQVMKFHAHPKFAHGIIESNLSISGKTGYERNETIQRNLYRNYNWDLMPDNFNNEFNQSSADEVGRLMLDLAVLNSADLGVTETSASVNTEKLIKYFNYSRTIATKKVSSSVSYDQVVEIIESEIKNGFPVLIALPGHLVVGDGYLDDESGEWVHINMGWGGSKSDFYNLDENVLDFEQTTNNFSVIYNIKPCSVEAGDCYTNLENSDKLVNINPTIEIDDLKNLNEINGSLVDGNDSDFYEFILSGDVNISRTSQYYNIALYDSNGSLIAESRTDNLNISNLNKNYYFVKVSQPNSSGSYYSITFPFKYSFKVEHNTSSEDIETVELARENIFVNGILEDMPNTDSDEYETILGGKTTILKASAGHFYNFALYRGSELLGETFGNEANNSFLYFDNLDLDIYTIKTSIYNSKGVYYPNWDGNRSKPKLIINTAKNSQENKDIIYNSKKLPPQFGEKPADLILSKDKNFVLDFADPNGDEVNLSITATPNGAINWTLDRNILTLHRLVDNRKVNINISAQSSDGSNSIAFDLITQPNEIAFGKVFSVMNKFLDGQSISTNRAILSGDCQIESPYEYGYIALFDDKNVSVADWSSETISKNILLGIYDISKSLKNRSTNHSYPFDENETNYVINISCPTAPEKIADIESLFALTTGDISILLNKGWNLISSPTVSGVVLNNSNNNLLYGFRYNSNSDNWELWNNGYVSSERASTYSLFSHIEPSKGYWLRTSESTSLLFSGDNINDNSKCPDISNLISGWHLLGSCSTSTPNDLLTQNEKALIIYKYVNGNWKAIGKNQQINDTIDFYKMSGFDSLSANEGFWIYIEE